MDQTTTDQIVQDDAEIAATDRVAIDEVVQGDAEIADELLIEEISIDGMCGVY